MDEERPHIAWCTIATMTKASLSDRFPPPQHDHGHCVSAAVETAESLCRTQGLRLTRTRRRVLELVWNSHKPVGAYDILDSINNEGKKAAPPTVYRALDFLIEANLVHRLDSINAFVGCPDPGHAHTGQILICRQCRSVAELDDTDISQLVEQKVSNLGFSAIHQMLEIQGLCQDCRDA